jgi:hypothetical protein
MSKSGFQNSIDIALRIFKNGNSKTNPSADDRKILKKKEKQFKLLCTFDWTIHRMLQKIYRHGNQEISTCHLHVGLVKDWLKDHVLTDNIVMPAAAILEFAYAASLKYLWASNASSNICLEGFKILQPVNVENLLKKEFLIPTLIRCTVSDNGTISFTSGASDEWKHAEGRIVQSFDIHKTSNYVAEDPVEIFHPAHDHDSMSCVDVDALYSAFSSCGLKYGSTFRLIESAKCSHDGNIVFGKLRVEKSELFSRVHIVAPPLLDAMLQLSAIPDLSSNSATMRPKVPFAFDRIHIKQGSF